MSQNRSANHSNDIVVYRCSDVFSYIINRYIQTYEDFVYKDDFGKYVFPKLMDDRNIIASFYLFLTEMRIVPEYLVWNSIWKSVIPEITDTSICLKFAISHHRHHKGN